MKPDFALLETAQRPAITGLPDAAGRQWVMVLPAGQAVPRDGRGPWKVADAAAVVRESLAWVGKAGMMVDYNHQSMHAKHNGKPAPAAGWVVKLEAVKGAVWALVEWTANAAAQIRAREFRHLSPVLIHDAAGIVRRIHNIGLVNEPALDDLVALAQTELPMDKMKDAMAGLVAALGMPPATLPEIALANATEIASAMTEIVKALGLPETAKPTDVLAKVREMLTVANSAAPDPAAFVPMALFESAVAEANSLRKGMGKAEAAAYVESAIRGGKLIPAMREWGVELCTVNKPAFESFLERTAGGLQTLLSVAVPAGAYRSRDKASDLSEDEAAIAARMGLTPEQYRAGRAGSNR